MNLYLKRFFLVSIMIFSFYTVLLPQSLSNKNATINSLFSGNERNSVESGEMKAIQLSDSAIHTTTKISEFKENSDDESFSLKSNSGIFSIFNEIVFYWFNTL